MRKNFFIYLLVFILALKSKSTAQQIWQKCTCNPIMVKDSSFYEGLAIGSPDVILDSGIFKMLYAAGGLDHKGRISYAFSYDGQKWVKYNNDTPVLDVDTGQSWDNFFLDTPSWLKDSSGYKMYYFGDNDNNPLNSAIGLAISNDGIHWKRYTHNPVLRPGKNGDWDSLYIESPTVVYAKGKYFMYFSGVDSSYKVRIGMALSTDGIHWTKYSNNPVLTEGKPGDWDSYSVATPSVIYKDSVFLMWYCGVSYIDLLDGKIDTIKVGMAYSYDGFNWFKNPSNPILTTYSPPFTEFEKRGPWAPTVLYYDSLKTFYMWYETAYGFGLATSKDNAYYNKPDELIKIYPNPTQGRINIQSKQNCSLIIANTMGQIVFHKNIKKGTNIVKLIVSEGIYFFIFKTQNSTITKKIIIL